PTTSARKSVRPSCGALSGSPTPKTTGRVSRRTGSASGRGASARASRPSAPGYTGRSRRQTMRLSRLESRAPADDAGRPELSEVMEHYDAPVNLSRKRRTVPCPLSGDGNPSCSVRLAKGPWRCHPCGEGGDSWSPIMKKEGVGYPGARAFAAAQRFAEGDAGGGGDELPAGRLGRSSSVSSRQRNQSGRGGYVPAGLRRRASTGT